MKITILSLELENFKGAKKLSISFKKETSIFGDNATGKTTIVDAFTWCLFGKDSSDRKDFEVKTLDSNNEVIPQLEHSVTAVLQVEQQVISLKRVLREKWTKRRGSTETEFTGNETLYFWNDVPCQQKEYQDKVSGIVDENLFKLITNPLYFNVNMKWQDRREVLFSMANKISDSDVFDAITTLTNKHQVNEVINVLNQGKSAVEYKKEISAKKKKLKDELALIPARIDEVFRAKPQPVDVGFITSKINRLKADLQVIEGEKESIVKAQQAKNNTILAKQNELNALKSKLQQLNFDLSKDQNSRMNELSNQIADLNRKKENAERSISVNSSDINNCNNSIAQLETANADLRTKWNEVNQQEFEMDQNKTFCPSCKRPLEDAEIHNIEATLKANFNESKTARLNEITQKGAANASKVGELKSSISIYESNISTCKSIINSVATDLELLKNNLSELQNEKPVPSQEIISLESEIQNFVIPTPEPTDFTELNIQRDNINNEIQALNKDLASEDQIALSNNRIAELQNQESEHSQQLADLESHEFVLDAFNKKRIDLMVEAVNSKFKFVKFKLFEKQINGGENEICEVLVNTNGAWVPFPNGNKAGQINAGLDIINTLCQFNNVYAPIFIDNRESVNELIPTESQIINLIVSNDKSLKIN